VQLGAAAAQRALGLQGVGQGPRPGAPEQLQVGVGQGGLEGGAQQVRGEHVRVLRVDQGGLVRAPEQVGRVVQQIGVERVVLADEHGQ
jgi:hypothetical protein